MKRSFRLIITSLIIFLILTLSGSIFAQTQSEKYIVATSADYPPFE